MPAPGKTPAMSSATMHHLPPVLTPTVHALPHPEQRRKSPTTPATTPGQPRPPPPGRRTRPARPGQAGRRRRALARQLGRRIQDILRRPARRITEPADGQPVFPLARAACPPPPPCQARGGSASAGDPMPRAGSPNINGRERQQSAPQSRPDRRERASLRSRTDHTASAASAASGRRAPYRRLGAAISFPASADGSAQISQIRARSFPRVLRGPGRCECGLSRGSLAPAGPVGGAARRACVHWRRSRCDRRLAASARIRRRAPAGEPGLIVSPARRGG